MSEADVGLVEEMVFEPSSELYSTDGWRAQMKRKTVPDSWSSNTEALSAELCPGSWDKHVTAMGRTKVSSTGGVDHCGADIFEVGWAGATDPGKCSSHNLELNLLGHRQSVEDITQDW